jgi:CysZ protein
MVKNRNKCGLIAGATYPFRALSVFVNNSYLWGYIVTPIVVNIILGIVIYGSSVYFGWQGLNDLLLNLNNWFDRLILDLPPWLNSLEYAIAFIGILIRLLLVIVLLIITGFLLVSFGVLLGAPWYGKLSEELEKLRMGKLEIVEVGFVFDLTRAILFELKKLCLILTGILVSLFLELLPGIGPILGAISGLTVTGTILCLDFMDAPLERRKLKFREKLKIIYGNFPATATFGLTCLLLMSVPLLNLITIPMCVASGTLFICDLLGSSANYRVLNN